MARPNEAPEIEAAHGTPDTKAIMDQQLDPGRASIAEDVGVVGARGAEDLNDTGQQTVGPRAHVHGLDSQPNGIDANHRSHSRSHVPQATASCAGAGPQTQVVNPGDNASFSVAVAGTPPLFYQWRRNGTNIAGATTSTLDWSNVQYTDAGSYSVRVTNASNFALSQPAELLVRPRFTSWLLLTNGGLQLTYQAMPNAGHAVEVSSNLVDWLRTMSFTNAAVQGQILDTNGTRFETGRAYRLRALP